MTIKNIASCKNLTPLLLFIAISNANPAFAGKIYTPAQLRGMIKNGKYPAQGKPTVQSQRVDYTLCIEKITSVVNSVRSEYPTSTILNTNIGRIEKVWTNDAALTLTCSAPDGTLAITTSPYL